MSEWVFDQRWDVSQEPDDEFSLAGTVKRANERLEEEAREAARSDFINAVFAGAWAPRTDLSTRPARFVAAYRAEFARLGAGEPSRPSRPRGRDRADRGLPGVTRGVRRQATMPRVVDPLPARRGVVGRGCRGGGQGAGDSPASPLQPSRSPPTDPLRRPVPWHLLSGALLSGWLIEQRPTLAGSPSHPWRACRRWHPLPTGRTG